FFPHKNESRKNSKINEVSLDFREHTNEDQNIFFFLIAEANKTIKPIGIGSRL
ncbi:unnamed protein product, partial [Arabidopsis halleri]